MDCVENNCVINKKTLLFAQIINPKVCLRKHLYFLSY